MGEDSSALGSSSSERALDAAPASGAAWYALKTRSRHEKVVARLLGERGVRVFLPLYKKRRRWSDRTKVIELPLFSTYLFVHIDPRERISVLRARGAVALLGHDGQPVPVAAREIDALLALEAAGAPLEPHRFVRLGQSARIHFGPFRGVEGTLVRRNGETKLVVSVTLFERSVALTVDAGCIEPA